MTHPPALPATWQLGASIALTGLIHPIWSLTEPEHILAYQWLTRPSEGGSPLALWDWARTQGVMVDLELCTYRLASAVRAQFPTRFFLNADPAMLEQSRAWAAWRELGPLVLELSTERAPNAHLLQQARSAQVDLAIDDWANGHNAIETLGTWHAQWLKFPRQFLLQALRSQFYRAMLEDIVQLAHTHQMGTVAVGIETDRELAVAQRAGVDGAQGYRWGQPQAVQHTVWTVPC